MKNKGQISFFEAMFPLIAVIIILFFVLWSASNFVTRSDRMQKELSLQVKAIFIADSMTKNHDQKNPLLGLAYKNKKYKRVENNIIEPERLQNTSESGEIAGVKIQSIRLKESNGSEKIVFNSKTASKGNCITAERFVQTEGAERKKALLLVMVCEK